MEKFIGFIPSTLNSPSRLPGKALSEIEGMPIIIHVAKRAALSSNLNKIVIQCFYVTAIRVKLLETAKKDKAIFGYGYGALEGAHVHEN